jgi:hypothetical protein
LTATRIARALVVALVATACAAQTASPASTSLPSGVQTCTAGEQDAYTYRPARLQILAACVRASGTVVELSTETDGDLHLNLRLDSPYRALLTPGNDFVDGYLIIEAVCQIPPLAADAVRVCAADPTPLVGIPNVGDHVSMEGRYVLDLQHHSWAELHPLYRWQRLAP